MKDYIAILKQKGGCDYTIGCGVDIIKIKSKTIEQAEEEVFNILRGGYTDIDGLDIYEVSSKKIVDINKFYKEEDEKREEEKKTRKEKKEREEYERLIRKFGDFEK